MDVFIAFMVFVVTIVVVMSFSVTTRSTLQEEVSVKDFLSRLSKDKVIESTLPILIDNHISNGVLPTNEITMAQYFIYLNNEGKEDDIGGIISNLSVNYIPEQYRLKMVINQTKPINKVYSYCEGTCLLDDPKIQNANYIVSSNMDFIVEKDNVIDVNNVILANLQIIIWHD